MTFHEVSAPDYAVLEQVKHMASEGPAGQQEQAAWEQDYGISLDHMVQRNAQRNDG